jgi:hypothetical protein
MRIGVIGAGLQGPRDAQRVVSQKSNWRESSSSRQTETTAELIGWGRGRQSSRPVRVLPYG